MSPPRGGDCKALAWLQLVARAVKCWLTFRTNTRVYVVLRRTERACDLGRAGALALVALLFRVAPPCLCGITPLLCIVQPRPHSLNHRLNHRLNHQPDESRRPPPTSLTAELERQEPSPPRDLPKCRNCIQMFWQSFQMFWQSFPVATLLSCCCPAPASVCNTKESADDSRTNASHILTHDRCISHFDTCRRQTSYALCLQYVYAYVCNMSMLCVCNMSMLCVCNMSMLVSAICPCFVSAI